MGVIKADTFVKTANAENELLVPMTRKMANKSVVDVDEIYNFDEYDADAPYENEDGGIDIPRKVIKLKPNVDGDSATPLCCPHCNYETHRRFLLSRHLQSHSDDRPFKCSICEKGFKTNVALTNHTNVHMGLKPHQCKDCDSGFTTSGELARHQRYRHTLEKPHKCPECGYASVELSKLRRHMRCHTGEVLHST